MALPTLFFVVIAAISFAAAVGVITSRLPVHSALFLLSHFVTLAVLYITLDAQFLAAVQIIVYAGGIVILILFVIMLIGSDKVEAQANDEPSWTPFVAMGLGLVLLGAIAFSMTNSFPNIPIAAEPLNGGIPSTVGFELFTRYILPIELVAVLLLVALLGAMLLARRHKEEAK